MNEYLMIAFSCTCVYFFLIIGLRLFGKKELAQLSVPDLVFVLLISNAVQNAMVGSNSTLLGGLTATTTLFMLNDIFKYFFYKYANLQKLIQGEPMVLIYQGNINENNLCKAKITINELMEIIREHGTTEIHKVNLAMLETDGNISLLTDDFKKQSIQSGLKKRKKYRSFNV